MVAEAVPVGFCGCPSLLWMTADDRTTGVLAAVGALVTTVAFMLEGGIMTAAVVIVLVVDGVILLAVTVVVDTEVVEVVGVAVVLAAVVLIAVVVVVTPDAPTHWIALMKTGEHWPPVDWS